MTAASGRCTLFGAMRPFVLAMAGPSKPPSKPKGAQPHGGNGSDDNRPRRVATWAAVITPIVLQVVGVGLVIYEVLTNINSPAALGAGLALATGGKAVDVLSELVRPR